VACPLNTGSLDLRCGRRSHTLCAKQCARSVLRIIRTTTSSGSMLEASGKPTPTQTGQTPVDLTSFGKKVLHGQARRRRICCSCRSSTRFPHVSRLGLRTTVLFGAHQAKVGTSSLCLLRITDTLTFRFVLWWCTRCHRMVSRRIHDLHASLHGTRILRWERPGDHQHAATIISRALHHAFRARPARSIVSWSVVLWVARVLRRSLVRAIFFATLKSCLG